jgi:3-dehydrosphinganine reductase
MAGRDNSRREFQFKNNGGKLGGKFNSKLAGKKTNPKMARTPPDTHLQSSTTAPPHCHFLHCNDCNAISTMNHNFRLALAAILALPALLILVAVAPVIAILSFPSLAILVRRKRRFLPSFSASSPSSAGGTDDAVGTQTATGKKLHPLLQHAIITGGSSGIGLSIAIDLARRNCQFITLIARNVDQLADAKRLVDEAATISTSTSSVGILSVDVTNFSALEKEVIKLCGEEDNGKAKNKISPVPGPPTLLFNCAGYAIPLAFENLSVSNFRAQMEVNYLGSVHVVKAFLPYMTNPSHVGGNIILTSSMSGQAGTFGYSSYSPTKFALRGFAECLSMELAAKMSNVNISIAYPPDTKTPGYEIENKCKPEECRLISESAGVWDPEV